MLDTEAACKARARQKKHRYLQKLRSDPARLEELRIYQQAYDAQRSTPERREYKRKQQAATRTVRRYGLTLAQRDAMLAAQGGCCALCLKQLQFGQGFGTAHIDHCHKTGRVRGVLCGRCNTSIGYFKDDPVRLRAAAAYLEKDRT